MTIAIYRLVGFNSLAPQATTVGTTSVTQAFQAKNLAIEAGSRTVNVSTSLSNLTNDFSSACGANLWGVHASGVLNGNGTLTSTISPTSNNPLIALGVWSTQAPPPVVSFDGVPSNVTLSLNKLTVTSAAGTTLGGGRSLSLQSTGKFYFEITITASHGNSDKLGIITSGGVYADLPAGNNSCSVTRASGSIFSNNVLQTVIGAISVPATVGFAFDLGNHLCWIRNGAGNWNGSGTANPATGVGGFTLATASYSPVVTFGAAGGTNGDNMTGNFIGSYVNTPPATFGNWTP